MAKAAKRRSARKANHSRTKPFKTDSSTSGFPYNDPNDTSVIYKRHHDGMLIINWIWEKISFGRIGTSKKKKPWE